MSMSLCPYVLMSLCHYVHMSLCHYVHMSLCPYVLMSLCHYVLMSGPLKLQSVPQLVKSLNVFFHNFLSSFIPKRWLKKDKEIWKSYYGKVDFKVKYLWSIDLFDRNKLQQSCIIYYIYMEEDIKKNCKNSLIFSIVYGRRHSKLFTNCHVSKDTLYENPYPDWTFLFKKDVEGGGNSAQELR